MASAKLPYCDSAPACPSVGSELKKSASVWQDLDVKVIRDYPQQGVPAKVQGTAKMALDILFLNSAVDATGWNRLYIEKYLSI